MYAVMHLLYRVLAGIANHLRSRADDELSVERWMRQQESLKAAIARARSENPRAAPARLDDEWLDPWIRQQARLRKAIAEAMPPNARATSAAARDDEWVDPWIRQQARLREAIAAARDAHQRSSTASCDPSTPAERTSRAENR